MADGDLSKLWKSMEVTGAGSMAIKAYRKEGDPKPFRLIVLIQGEEEVEDALKILKKAGFAD